MLNSLVLTLVAYIHSLISVASTGSASSSWIWNTLVWELPAKMGVLQLLFLNSLCRASVEEIRDRSIELSARVPITTPHVSKTVVWDINEILLAFRLSFSHSHHSSTGRANLLQVLPPEEVAADLALARGPLVGQGRADAVLLPKAETTKMTKRKPFRRPA